MEPRLAWNPLSAKRSMITSSSQAKLKSQNITGTLWRLNYSRVTHLFWEREGRWGPLWKMPQGRQRRLLVWILSAGHWGPKLHMRLVPHHCYYCVGKGGGTDFFLEMLLSLSIYPSSHWPLTWLALLAHYQPQAGKTSPWHPYQLMYPWSWSTTYTQTYLILMQGRPRQMKKSVSYQWQH